MYIVYAWYVWTGRDFLKAGFNNIIIPILCSKLLRLILKWCLRRK